MKKIEFNKLLQEKTTEEIIRYFYECKINLTPAQLKKTIQLQYENRGR
jgi:hypothetical protein